VVAYSVFIVAAAAIYVFWELRNRTDGVQRAILFGLIWGCGPRVFTYSLLDEIVLSLVSAYMLLFRRDELRVIMQGLRRHKVYWMPTVLCLFLAVHSLFSVAILDDPRMVKWTMVFVAVPFIIAFLPRWLSGSGNPDGPPVRFVMVHLSLYFITYILQGVVGEIFIGSWGRFHTQELYWQGSSLAVMPVMVFFACSFFFPEQYLGGRVRIFYFSVLLGFCAFFFDSRIMQLLIVCCPLAGLVIYLKGYRHWVAMLVAFICCFYVNVTLDNNDVAIRAYVNAVWEKAPPEVAMSKLFGERKMGSLGALDFGARSLLQSTNVMDPMANDIDRKLQVSAAVEASLLNRTSLVRFFGTGFYSHRYEIGHWVKQKYMEALPGFSESSLATDFQDGSRRVFRTTALAGYIIDTGILGLLLMGVVLFSATYYALESGARVFLGGGICTSLALAWTYSNFSFENVLWFLLMFIVTGLCRQSGNLIPPKLA